jgi:Protein of unknown function (DUF1572)
MLTHTSYHVGQIVYLSRLLTKEGWQWITVPPGQGRQVKDKGGQYLEEHAGGGAFSTTRRGALLRTP